MDDLFSHVPRFSRIFTSDIDRGCRRQNHFIEESSPAYGCGGFSGHTGKNLSATYEEHIKVIQTRRRGPVILAI